MATASNPKRSVKEYRCGICGRIFDTDETLNAYQAKNTNFDITFGPTNNLAFSELSIMKRKKIMP